MFALITSSSVTTSSGSLSGSTNDPLCRVPSTARRSSFICVMFFSKVAMLLCLRSSMKSSASISPCMYCATLSCRSSIFTWSEVGSLASAPKYMLRRSYISSTRVDSLNAAFFLLSRSVNIFWNPTNPSNWSGRSMSSLTRWVKLARAASVSSRAEVMSRFLMVSSVRCVTGSSVFFRLLLSTCSVPSTFCVFILSSSVRQSRCLLMSWRYLRMSIFWVE
mmetsp:Transcript_8078/g.16576  ORF Transcript_8078/g.16576 Transcript_8078/m.16576 type:complete len:220 (+) Transcript_8078:791-1450(+)